MPPMAAMIGRIALLGFDNAHRVPRSGGSYVAAPDAADHWHRDEHDGGRPYRFIDADTLIVDFFGAVQAKLNELGVSFDVQTE